ncbi:MAG: HAD-IB family phosphatase [Desulfurococcales archaeon]|nr:HAD-IB family phosphatase [Desulfurococcales archaeon]
MSKTRIKLVLFDVDGVLVDNKSSWQVIHELLGVMEEAEFGARLYLESVIDYLGWMKHDTSLWAKRKRIHIDELRRAFDRIKVKQEAVEISRVLHRMGFIIGLVSAGIDLLVSRVAKEVGADIWVANKLSYDKRGYLIEGGVPLVPAERKDIVVRRIMGELNVDSSETAFVGDSVWDIPAFLVVGLPIGYGGDERIRPYVKYVIRDLRELPDILAGYNG